MLFHRSVLVLLSVGFLHATSVADEITPEQLKFFEARIRPVLIRECYGCHSNQSGNARGGLRLDTKALTLIGGSSGPSVVPGDPDESFLYTAMRHDDFIMPPKRKLPDNVIEDFRKWIEMGAPDPRVEQVAEIQGTVSEEDIEDAKKSFWAYQRPVSYEPPNVENESWARTDVDPFILEKLEQSSITPAEDAEPYKVLRRICFDLVGLPPNAEQIDYFNKRWKQDPDAAIKLVVERLLESEQFGERWGRHWLDVVRYAESTGREVNMTYPHAWRYRDYVIDSFNQDKPFNEFVQEHIAGDLMPAKSDKDWAENLVATTFLAMGSKNVNEQNRVQFNADVLDEQIDATTRVFMGMSVACARCHDHKFDAIPQTDYYAMAGLFNNMETYWGVPPSEFGRFTSAQTKRSSSLILLPIDDPNPFDKSYTREELADLKQELVDIQQGAADSRRQALASGDAQAAIRNRLRSQNQLMDISGKIAVVDDNGNPNSYCMGVQEQGSPQNARLLIRGEIDQIGNVVQRGFPQVLCSTPVEIDSKESGRLELARWIGSDENTLTARVMVNRIWQHLIGQGLVTSTENFGVTGQPPTHPELLDHLAVKFVESGWSVKSIVREIVNSRTYRMRSTYDERNHEFDPDNSLVWRANPRRLDAEAIRDAMLSISGLIEFERPRASEVARHGYSRVRDGTLGDPRETAQRLVSEAGNAMRQAYADRMRRGGGSRGFQGGFRGGPGNTGGSQPGSGQGFGGSRGRFGSFRGRSGFDRQAAQSAMEEVARKIRNQLDMEDANFRSVYLPIVRDEVPRSLEVFDFADASTVSGTRESSQTANQALYMMNNPLVIRASDAFAKKLDRREDRVGDQMALAFKLTYGREATQRERSATAAFVRSLGGTESQTLALLCQSLFASAEFRFID